MPENRSLTRQLQARTLIRERSISPPGWRNPCCLPANAPFDFIDHAEFISSGLFGQVYKGQWKGMNESIANDWQVLPLVAVKIIPLSGFRNIHEWNRWVNVMSRWVHSLYFIYFILFSFHFIYSISYSFNILFHFHLLWKSLLSAVLPFIVFLFILISFYLYFMHISCIFSMHYILLLCCFISLPQPCTILLYFIYYHFIILFSMGLCGLPIIFLYFSLFYFTLYLFYFVFLWAPGRHGPLWSTRARGRSAEH